jgi:hypothetical protein
VLGHRTQRHLMSKLTALMGFLFLAVSSAWAQTLPPPLRPALPPRHLAMVPTIKQGSTAPSPSAILMLT